MLHRGDMWPRFKTKNTKSSRSSNYVHHTTQVWDRVRLCKSLNYILIKGLCHCLHISFPRLTKMLQNCWELFFFFYLQKTQQVYRHALNLGRQGLKFSLFRLVKRDWQNSKLNRHVYSTYTLCYTTISYGQAVVFVLYNMSLCTWLWKTI